MIIRTLVENTTSDHRLSCEHGISLYIEYDGHRVLFDVGASSMFSENALKMGIDIASVDFLVISHGHSDHGGGLKTFLDLNHTATVYIHKSAFEPHFSLKQGELVDIGLDPEFKIHRQIVLTDDYFRIDEHAFLFSGVSGNRFFPSMNMNLYKNRDRPIRDDFDHEQNLIIEESGIRLMSIGCAHHGIINILDHVRQTFQIEPTHVIGGFHMSSRSTNHGENPEIIRSVAHELRLSRTTYYTGHCTGTEAYHMMKKILGKQLQKFTTGKSIRMTKEENHE